MHMRLISLLAMLQHPFAFKHLLESHSLYFDAADMTDFGSIDNWEPGALHFVGCTSHAMCSMSQHE